MGYRARLGRVAKKEKERFVGKSYEEVKTMLLNEGAPYRPDFHIQLYELGKYFNFTKGTKSFYAFDIEKVCGAEFFIMSKEELKELIEECHDIIYQNYAHLLQGNRDIQEFLASRVREWCAKFLTPYYLDQEKTDGEIVCSWQYEYAIFNLVYIYRTFNWEKDYLIYSAW